MAGQLICIGDARTVAVEGESIARHEHGRADEYVEEIALVNSAALSCALSRAVAQLSDVGVLSTHRVQDYFTKFNDFCTVDSLLAASSVRRVCCRVPRVGRAHCCTEPPVRSVHRSTRRRSVQGPLRVC